MSGSAHTYVITNETFICLRLLSTATKVEYVNKVLRVNP